MSKPDENLEGTQNKPIASQDDVSHRQPGFVQVDWSAPMPPPAVLQRYEETLPGAADRILTMAEKQQDHRQEQERTQQSHHQEQERKQQSHRYEQENALLAMTRSNIVGSAVRSYLGMILGFLIAITGIVCGTYLVANGNGVTGLAAFVASLATLAGVSVYGIKTQLRGRQSSPENSGDE